MTLIIDTLRERFTQNMHRHPEINWDDVVKHLDSNIAIKYLEFMESTGGEPDVVGYNTKDDTYIFMDCSRESPIGRRSLCYDRQALDSRRENKPKDTVIDMANSI